MMTIMQMLAIETPNVVQTPVYQESKLHETSNKRESILTV